MYRISELGLCLTFQIPVSLQKQYYLQNCFMVLFKHFEMGYFQPEKKCQASIVTELLHPRFTVVFLIRL